MTRFSSLVQRRQHVAGAHRFSIDEGWLQGRTCYGGLVAALAAQAMHDEAGAGWPADVSLRALQTSFVAPVNPGLLDITVQVLRQGKNVCQVMAHARQDDQIAAVLLGVFSADRPSALQPRLPQPDRLPMAADQLPMPPEQPSRAPTFLQHFDMRWADGPPPFSGGQGWRSSLFIRQHRDDLAAVRTDVQIVLVADLAPTPVIGQLSSYAPNSSVTWALELRPVRAVQPGEWWRADNESTMVAGGYVNHAARLWAPSGELGAFGYQVVAVFA